MSRTELYTPWREATASLARRTVGREALQRRLQQSADELAEGHRPLPIYLFGPRGVGKSHLVALLRPGLEARGLEVRYVPEDLAALRSAEELLAACNLSSQPAWMRWSLLAAEPGALPESPTVIVVEALDRRLAELGRGDEGRLQRQRLRSVWSAQENPVWVIGTGVALGTELTDHTEPFYGWFDPEAIELLQDTESAELLDRMVPADVRERPHWKGRRASLVSLAGGSPRVLVTLAETCASPDGPAAATDALLEAVDRFTPHFQLRFRDLPPFGQHIVEMLALAPRAMTPGELATRLQTSAPSLATQARRLADDGVLHKTEDGRSAWYTLVEPLFRYWLEYRTAPWETTRIALASSLLDELFAPAEIVERWWGTPEDLPALSQLSERLDSPWLGAACRFWVAIRKGGSPRACFRQYLEEASPQKTPGHGVATHIVLQALEASGHADESWKPFAGADARKLAALPYLRAAMLVRGRLSSHPPVLRLSSLQGLSSEDADIPELLASGIILGSEALVERALSLRTHHRLPDNPRPLQLLPVGTEALVRWIVEEARVSSALLSWARSFAEMCEEQFVQILSTVRSALYSNASPWNKQNIELALLALGTFSPERLQRLAVALQPPWNEPAIEAQALLAQLREPHLHPELAKIREALERSRDGKYLPVPDDRQ
jgi:hypothetical protein